MHAISSYRGNTQTRKQTHRQDWLQYTAPQLASAQCNDASCNTRGMLSTRILLEDTKIFLMSKNTGSGISITITESFVAGAVLNSRSRGFVAR